jgi:hypothetical protein
MPYCSRCGVEVDDSVARCPLCDAPIQKFSEDDGSPWPSEEAPLPPTPPLSGDERIALSKTITTLGFLIPGFGRTDCGLVYFQGTGLVTLHIDFPGGGVDVGHHPADVPQASLSDHRFGDPCGRRPGMGHRPGVRQYYLDTQDGHAHCDTRRRVGGLGDAHGPYSQRSRKQSGRVDTHCRGDSVHGHRYFHKFRHNRVMGPGVVHRCGLHPLTHCRSAALYSLSAV